MAEEFDFSDLTIQERTVKIGKESYILREASGSAVAKWRNAQLTGMTIVDNRPQRLGPIGDLQPLLVAECLFLSDGKTRVSREVVDNLPERILSPLYDWIMEVSELKGTPSVELKNDKASTAAG